MDYKDFEEEDFVADEYFQRWVLDSDLLINNFWESWLKSHPEKRETVEEATRLILLLQFKEDLPTQEQFNTDWRRIQLAKQKFERENLMLTSDSKRYNYGNLWFKIAASFNGISDSLTSSVAMYFFTSKFLFALIVKYLFLV